MKKVITFLMMLVLIISLAACSSGAVESAAALVQAASASEAASSLSAAQVSTAGENAVQAVSSAAGDTSAASTLLAENSATHDDADDYVWDSATVIPIALNGDSISVDGAGVTVEGSRATIVAPGTYSLSGVLADGQLVVNSQDEGLVRLILDGVEIHSSTGSPIYVQAADEVMLVLADGSQNTVSDAQEYVFADASLDEPNAAIFSASDLTIYGNGALTVSGNYNDGIASKDGLLIASGTIAVSAADDGMRGKDYVVVKDGDITINALGDGLKSDNEEDAAKGYISIENGVFAITAGGDAITAQTDVLVANGKFTLTSGGGSAAQVAESASAKGIKGAASVVIDGGTFTIDSTDDALHSNGSLTINAGLLDISTGDDGMHADETLTINGGEIEIADSYEGLESSLITINDGTIRIVSSDDGLNVAAGVDGSGGMQPGMGQPGAPGQDAFTYTGSYYLYINGGYVAIDATGDGLDVNGAIEMTGGVVLVNGPTENMNGAVDYDATFNISGGLLVAAGSAGMAQAPGQSSTQYSLLIYLSAAQPAGTLIHIQDSAGQDILTFAPSKSYQSIALSSPQLINGETYTVSLGGSSSGAQTDSLYQGGTYTPGAQYTSFTISGTVTQIGSGGGGFGGRPGRP